MKAELNIIGKTMVRKDALAKTTGQTLYTADIKAEDVKHGVVLRSPHHHARILSMDTSQAEAMPGIHRVITAADVPGVNRFGPIVQDQPALAEKVVRHFGEPVAVIVADTRAAAKAALSRITVQYEKLPSVHDPLAALSDDAPSIHPDGNLLSQYLFRYGDSSLGMVESDVIVEETFNVPRISPGYLEPENSLALYNPDGTLIVWTNSQMPFVDRGAIADVLGLPVEKIIVRLAAIGGAFGGKEDSSLAVLTGLAAFITKSNVRLVNERNESFLAHSKRHPAQMHLKLGINKEGKLLAFESTVHLDTGAYASYGPAVGTQLSEVISGPYRIPNVCIDTKVVYTNAPKSGAMRGFGGPQAHFAIESLMDVLAAKLGMDPLELRRRNHLRPGDELFSKVKINNTVEALPVILSRIEEARASLLKKPAPAGSLAGVGFATVMQSIGLGNHIQDNSSHRVEWQMDGSLRLFLGAPDLGQGLASVCEQILAEELAIPYEAIQTAPLDTSITPNGGVTCASRLTYLAGSAMQMAAAELKEKLLSGTAGFLGIPRSELTYQNGSVVKPDGSAIPAATLLGHLAEDGQPLQASVTATFKYPKESTPQHLPVGMPHIIFATGGQVVRVEVDPQIFTVRVTDVVAIHDVGKAINPGSAKGQIEGAIAMGIGYGLYEEMFIKGDGRWVDSFTEYPMPTIADMPPEIDVQLLEIPEASGPYGAKGVGEIGLVPTAPAIANAVYNACGVRMTHLPITPIRLAEALQK